MNGISKAAKIITKILEVFHWVGAGLLSAAAVCSAVAPQHIGYFVSFDAKDCCGASLEAYGFEVNAAFSGGSIDMMSFLLFGIGASVILALMAMVFRNLHLIFKKSENGSPFQKDNIRLLKQVGIFSIAVPLVGLFMGFVIRLVVGADASEVSVDLGGLFMGLVILCLTQYFLHGAALEDDVNGLV